ncbi:hypothetical protein DCCM_0279 [Desulfocucumis palustris]|uniref:Uncharacterized protein n=1 Tax=Desulfocucumis palustris TaxID=1898651 RepID=A0A2L2X7M7_9FIRM|nr:hypothetical protein DCCM_0279 [Desulfocucumis palustris]
MISSVAIPAGIIAAAAGAVGVPVAFTASKKQGWNVKINDQHYTISIV